MSIALNGKNGTMAQSKRKGVRRVSRLSTPWLAFAIAVLFAFLAQSFVTQTHHHLEASAAISAKFDGASSRAPGKQTPADLPSDCQICRELAHAGPLLLPTPVTVEAPVLVAYWAEDTRPSTFALTRRSHAWQSRAPPSQLQA